MSFLTFIHGLWKKSGWQIRLIAFLVLLMAIGAVYYSCRENSLKREIEREKQARSDEQQADIDEARTEANKSANETNQARENVNRIENANFNNTSLDEANRLRCKAFPERCK